MADTPPKNTKQEMKILREQEKNHKLMKQIMKGLKANERTPSVAGKKLTRKNVDDMKGPDARKDVEEFAPELEGILSIAKEKAKEGAGDLKDKVISAIPGGKTALKLLEFRKQRNLVKEARSKAAAFRENYNTLIKESAMNYPAGFSKFSDAVKKSYKGDDNIHEVMVDTLVKMGVTTAEELDTLFKQLEGNVSDDAVATAISAEVSKAGFETKSGGLSGIPALGGIGSSSDSSDGGAQSSGVGGAGNSEDFRKNPDVGLGLGGKLDSAVESSDVGGLQTSVESELVLNDISSSLTTQTELLEDIKKAVSPKSGDKAKAKENKLEHQVTTRGLGSALSSAGGGDGGDGGDGGGGGGGAMSMLTQALSAAAGGAAAEAGFSARNVIKNGVKSVGNWALKNVPGVKPVADLVSRGVGTVKNAASSAGGWISNAWKGAKNLGGRALKSVGRAAGSVGRAVGSVASSLNPMRAIGNAVRSGGPKILKLIGGVPGIGALIETAISAYNISQIKKDPYTTVKEKKKAIGIELGSGLGGALGSIGGAVLGSFIPIPGAGTVLGAFAGGMAGNWLGGKLAEVIGGEGIYDAVSKFPIIGDLIKVDELPPPSGIEGEAGTVSAVSSGVGGSIPSGDGGSIPSGVSVPSGDGGSIPSGVGGGSVLTGLPGSYAGYSLARAENRKMTESEYTDFMLRRAASRASHRPSATPHGSATSDMYVEGSANNISLKAAEVSASLSLDAEGSAASKASAQIDQSNRSIATATGGSTVNSTSNIIAPSTSSNVSNTYTTTRVAQEEASMMASQMINGGSKFSVNRFA